MLISVIISVQLEELLEPYLNDTDLGLPYWDWTKDANIPDVWEDILSPVKAMKSKRRCTLESVLIAVSTSSWSLNTMTLLPLLLSASTVEVSSNPLLPRDS